MEAISPLNCNYLSVQQIHILHNKDIKTFMDLLKAPADFVQSALEITESDYSNIRLSALKYVQPQPTCLRQIATSRRVTPKSTGITSLDTMLGGGIFPGDMIELYGKTGTGKTQLCLHLASQFCHFSEEISCVLYFDMKNDFNADRLHKFCQECDESLARVKVFGEPNLEGLISQLDDIKNQFIGGINGFYSRSKLLILDSVPMVIYPAVQQEAYSWRFHQEKLLEKLQWLAKNLNLAVILVNHAVTVRAPVTTNKSGSLFSPSSSQCTVKAAMGKYWFHKINIRINLSNLGDSKKQFVAKLDKSGRGPEGQSFKFFLDDTKLFEVDKPN